MKTRVRILPRSLQNHPLRRAQGAKDNDGGVKDTPLRKHDEALT